MQMETNHMSCSAVRNASPPHLASPPVTATWNTVHKLKTFGGFQPSGRMSGMMCAGFPVNEIELFCCRLSSPCRRPPRPAGGPGGGGAHCAAGVPGGRGCVAPGAAHARAATRHALADAAGSHRHWAPESAAAGVCSQQVELLLTPPHAKTWI